MTPEQAQTIIDTAVAGQPVSQSDLSTAVDIQLRAGMQVPQPALNVLGMMLSLMLPAGMHFSLYQLGRFLRIEVAFGQ